MTINPDSVKRRPDTRAKRERQSAKRKDEPSEAKELKDTDKKISVLETHGYFLGEVIGMGSYATVKLATSSRHSSVVACKIISKVQAPEDYLKKFLPREIEVVKGLRHPNLIRFLQAIETTHRVYIIMEYAKNGSLLETIRKERHIQEDKARKWFSQMVDAIDYCHKKTVVHRDIKCENLLLNDDYDIKLSDFGFARKHPGSADPKYKLSETFCGSYAYASPEILKGIPYMPQQSDIWSLGVVLFAMVYGRLPFDDTNYSDLLKQVQNRVVFPESPPVSSACNNLISKILSHVKVRSSIEDIKKDPWMKQTSQNRPLQRSGKSKSAPEVISNKKAFSEL